MLNKLADVDRCSGRGSVHKREGLQDQDGIYVGLLSILSSQRH